MLDGMRKISQHWIGRAIMTVLFGLLIVSFVDLGHRRHVPRLRPEQGRRGRRPSISAQQFQNALQTVMYRIQSRTHRNL